MKRKKNGAIEFWKTFLFENKAIAVVVGIAMFYCVICVIFKSSSFFNVSNTLRPWGDLLFNISISIIAAGVFFVVQVFYPERKRKQILLKYAKKVLEEEILQCANHLTIQLEILTKNEKDEKEIRQSIDNECMKIDKRIEDCLSLYANTISSEILDVLYNIKTSDFFFKISKRAHGELVGLTMNKILSERNEEEYKQFKNNIEKLKVLTKKL